VLAQNVEKDLKELEVLSTKTRQTLRESKMKANRLIKMDLDGFEERLKILKMILNDAKMSDEDALEHMKQNLRDEITNLKVSLLSIKNKFK